MKLIEEGEPKESVLLSYQWLLNKTVPAEHQDEKTMPNLCDMLFFLLETGAALVFNLESGIEKVNIAYVITNNRLQENRVIPILRELLLAEIFEKLSDMESEITQLGKETVVKVKFVERLYYHYPQVAPALSNHVL